MLSLKLSCSICRWSCVLFCFFFQAEDGIRDLTVTGVQTCALPIFPAGFSWHLCKSAVRAAHSSQEFSKDIFTCGGVEDDLANERSEERRVGKECRSRWWRYN